MNPSDETALQAALARLGLAEATFLGSGGEARVYALDDERVLRITHPGCDTEQITKAIDLVRNLDRPDGLGLPHVLEIWESEGRVLTIERRFAGRSLLEDLGAVGPGPGRAHLIESHLEASDAVGDMLAATGTDFGEFLVTDPIRATTLHEFLDLRARWSLTRAGLAFPSVDVTGLVASLPDLVDPAAGCLVHLDAFAGNMMSDGTRVTAVFDFGGAVVIGAPWMNAVGTAVYLTVPTITPTATAADVDVARSWLRSRSFAELEDPFRRWLAAYWAFAIDDQTLHAWCRSVFA